MHITLYLPDLTGGGIERLYLGMAGQFVRSGHRATLLLNANRGALADQVPAGVDIDELGARRQATSVPALVRYLRSARPDIVMSGHDHNNIMLAAAGLARPKGTRIVVSQHNSLSANDTRGTKFGPVPFLYRRLFGRADAIVAVSDGVAGDLAAICGIERGRIDVVHNGIVPDDLARRTDGPVVDGVIDARRPTVLAVGRLAEQKDYPTLLDAFARMRGTIDAKLVILGDGPLRANLEQRARELGIGDHVAMPGFLDNPFAYMARARLLVLSSRHEGFGNVVAEALACGTPVVATDCRHGPAEILDGGRYGRLVPVGDVDALAAAMAQSLVDAADRDLLRRRGQDFTEAACAHRYLTIFERIAKAGRNHPSRQKEVA